MLHDVSQCRKFQIPKSKPKSFVEVLTCTKQCMYYILTKEYEHLKTVLFIIQDGVEGFHEAR